MRVWIRTPFSTEKNLGKAYNEEMQMIPEGDAACFIDGDLMFLTHDYGNILNDYGNLYPNSVLVCRMNRINAKATGQIDQYAPTTSDIADHIKHANSLSSSRAVTRVQMPPVSGALMVVPKSVWNKIKFAEQQPYEDRGPFNLLGVDNDWTNRVRAAGIEILTMEGLYCWHTYRLLTNTNKHLL